MQKEFWFLAVIKMEKCKLRLDTDSSVICELVSICCEYKINKVYDLHLMSSRCTVCMDSKNKTIV